MTVLFCDITNSMVMAQRLGRDRMHRVLDRFLRIALDSVHAYEGTVNQFLGDGFMALFGAPIAHEDHALRGVLAAFRFQQALAERQDELAPAAPGEVVVRIGINTGRVVVGEIGDNLRKDFSAVGDATNVAARLQQMAAPGSIYISETTYQAVHDHVECRNLGRRRVKGKDEPVAVYRVIAARPPSKRESEWGRTGIHSPLVGRDGARSTLEGCIERLLAGRGGLVSVLGEAGLGKSRLLAEVSRTAITQDLLWLEGRALSFGQTLSYWPFLEILRRWAGITEDDGDAESLSKLRGGVGPMFPEGADEVLTYLALMLGIAVPRELNERIRYLDPQATGQQIYRTTRRFFERLAQERPVMLVFEDIHWADQSSAKLIEHLFPLVETVPILLCGVGRPERQSPAARLTARAAESYPARYTELTLAPLSPAESARLTRNLLDGDDVPPEVQQLVFQKAEGNPFFVEEVVRALIDMRALVRERADMPWRVNAPLEDMSIPDTLQGVITARVDRLEEDVKQLLKLAAVIGRSFFHRVLGALASATWQLDRDLDELQQLELIRERRRVPELEYIFKHALVQEATYDSIVLDRRRQMHREVADCFETLFADRLDEFYSLLAHHYACAEEWEKAQAYLLKAGDQAGRVAADTEALAHYRQALTAYESAFGDQWDPLDRAILERKMGEALFRRGEHQQASEYLRRALQFLGMDYPASRWGIRVGIGREVLRQIVHRVVLSAPRTASTERVAPAVEEASRIFNQMAWVDYFVNEERLLLDVLMLLNTAERSGFAVGIVQGSSAFGLVCDLVPLFGLAKRYHRRAIGLAERIQHPLELAHTYDFSGAHEYFQGHWDAAIEQHERAAAACRAAGDLRGWGVAIDVLATALYYKGSFAESLPLHQELARMGEEVADRQIRAFGLHGAGGTLSAIGRLDDAAASFRGAIELLTGIPDHRNTAMALANLGQCYLRQGRLPKALAALEESNRLVVEKAMRGHAVTYTRNGLAEAYLTVAEHADSSTRALAMRRAKQACRGALKQSRVFRGAVPEATRLQGTYEWLRGSTARARKWWSRSLVEAEALGCRYERAMTDLEIGKRLDEPASLIRAAEVFCEVGARLDLGFAWCALGEIHARDPADVDQAEAYYRRALALTGEHALGALEARCHLGLGRFYRMTGSPEQAHEHIATAMRLYREGDISPGPKMAAAEMRALESSRWKWIVRPAHRRPHERH